MNSNVKVNDEIFQLVEKKINRLKSLHLAMTNYSYFFIFVVLLRFVLKVNYIS